MAEVAEIWGAMEYHEVEAIALQLPPRHRSQLIERLMDSLDGEEDGGRWIDARAEQAWIAEIQRRVDAVERGEVMLIAHEDVMAELKARLAHPSNETS